MSEERPAVGAVCHQCGAKVLSAAPEGLCPKCLVGMGLSLMERSGRGEREKGGKGELSPAPPLPFTPAPPPPSGQPRRFGDYELLDEIARGGMGVVYRARQLSLNRIVAVKVLLFGQFASDTFVKRFRAEAEAAASLQHPNIVAVHEVGEHEGQHYFSMELIEGRSLAEFVREKPLPPQEAARFVKAIAEAIEHAHRHGVLHRDLKPSNVLIDATGQPRVTDFGLAKRLAGTRSAASGTSPGAESDAGERVPADDLTVTGQVLGSPNYMPPEQADPKRGPVSAASDVYSMGAILYHLLTGRPPFLAETVEQTLSQLLGRDPAAPRLLNIAIPRDLETICLKCLEKEPARRYATAGQLVNELGRFLRNEPILARPAGPVEKFWRWCRRKPAMAALSGALAAVLISGATGIVWAWRRAKADEAVARTEANKSQQMARFLQQMLYRVAPSASLGRDTTLLREILDQTAARLDQELTNQPAVSADLRDTIGHSYYGVGEYAKAAVMHREAVRLRREPAGPENVKLAMSLHLLAMDLAALNQLDEAESANREALAIRKRLLGPDDLKIGTSLNSLGNIYFRRRDFNQAQQYLEQALAIFRRTDAPETAAALSNLANVRTELYDYVGAEKLYREAVALARKQDGDSHPTTALYLRNLGDVLRAQGKLTEADAIHSEALAVRISLLDEMHPLLADSFERLAIVKSSEQLWPEAETLYRKALAVRRKQSPDDPRKWDDDASALADVLNQQGKFDETERLMTELIAATREADPRAARLFSIRGSARARHGQWREALPDLAQAVELAPTEHWYAMLLAPLLVESGDQKAYDVFCGNCLVRFAGATNPDVAIRMAQACLISPSSGADLTAAESLLDSALSAPGYGGKVYAVGPKALAECRGARPAEALARVDELLRGLANGKWQTGRFIPIQAHAIRAMAHHALGHRDEARAALDRAWNVAPAKIATPANGDYGGNWHEWLTLQIYLREAQTLIEAAPGGTGNGASPKL